MRRTTLKGDRATAGQLQHTESFRLWQRHHSTRYAGCI